LKTARFLSKLRSHPTPASYFGIICFRWWISKIKTVLKNAWKKCLCFSIYQIRLLGW